ncbi:Ig-like domain-containing protein [Leeuwenhoekiella sp. ZYFB001]|uniref:Ig-like domain-containing protein n=1 Tax=Leeuwenhoekiella sp. ZYFB001 TaxID=2719912 RepID=UPI003977A7F7
MSDVTVAEGSEAVFVVSIDNPSTEDVVVDVVTVPGSALAGDDYTPVTTTVTIPAGQTSVEVAVSTLNDDLYEGEEQFTLEGTVTSGNTSNTDPVGTATITDNPDDLPEVSISDVTVAEGSEAVFVVSIDNPSTEDVVVDVVTVPGSALAGDDYTPVTTTVTIPAGQTSVEVAVSTLNDDLYEGEEQFTLEGTVTSGNTSNTDPVGTATITDNPDDLPEVSISDVTVAEGSEAVFVVSIDNPSTEDVVVDVVTVPGSALAGDDYTPVTTTVTIPAGQTSVEVAVSTLNDDLYEGEEQFTLEGTVTSGNTSNTDPVGTATITDNPDDLPEVSISDVTVAEGSEAVFVVSIDNPSTEDVVVDVVTVPGSALAGDDYTPVTTTVTIPAGQTESTPILVSTIDDDVFEEDETFTVIGTVISGTVANSPVQATGTITSNEILAINDINDTFEGQPVSGDVGTNDENPDGPADSEVYTVLTQPASGSLVFNADGTYTYTPNDGFIGEDTFSYEVCDGGSPQACDSADVIIQVLPIGTPDNAAPVANDDTAITEAGTPVDGNVLVNDFDPDGDTITVTGNTEPTNGSVTVNPDGSYTYTPEPGFIGEDSFEYTVCDDADPSLCATGTVTIEVVADTDNTTVANDDAFFGYIGEEITGNVLTNDSDPEGDAISVISNTQPANGNVTVAADGSLTYTPNTDFSGADQFTYTIEDANGAQDTATVYISVDPSENGGNTILAINDINDTFEGQPVSGDVGTNDENPDGPADSEVYSVLTQPASGSLVFNADGTYTYTPNDGFIGEDTFSYEVCDGGSPQACDSADVIIQVLPIGTPDNAAPVANDDTAITEAGTPVEGNVLVNDFDPDGDTITVTGNTEPTNGSVTVNPDGSYTYTPEPGFIGEDSFEYTVCDDADPSLCATGTVTIEVVADTDNTTVANDDAFFGYIGEEITGNVLTNDSDPEGDAISVISNTQPANGNVTVAADGSLTYTPNTDFSGADQFTYTIEDANGAQDTATVYISVDPSENGGNTILAINDINDTFEGQPVSGDVGTNDENPDGPADSEVYTVLTQPASGSLVFNADGTYTYTPNDGFIGEDTFSYEVCDGGSPQACDSADVIIQVLPIGTPDNAAPVANDDTAITEAGTPVEGNVLVNDFDPDGDTITVTGNTEPTNGSVTVNPDGSYTYTPEPGFIGEDSFEYTVCDDADPSLCATGTVTIEVVADTDNTTVANDDAFFGYIGEEITGNVLTNDSDPEGDAISVISNTQPANGNVTVAADGSLTYTPNTDFSGADQFTYTIEDANGAQDTATVYISVDPSENGGNTILAINDINDTFEGHR